MDFNLIRRGEEPRECCQTYLYKTVFDELRRIASIENVKHGTIIRSLLNDFIADYKEKEHQNQPKPAVVTQNLFETPINN